jgi:hypothetical protein
MIGAFRLTQSVADGGTSVALCPRSDDIYRWAASAAKERAMSPHDILTAYSKGQISSADAIFRLRLDGYRDLFLAMTDAGHPLPRPAKAEIDQQVIAALPLLREALIEEGEDA